MIAGGTFAYQGYRIEAFRGFRNATIHPPYGGLPLETLASASGEDREEALLADARRIINEDIAARAGL